MKKGKVIFPAVFFILAMAFFSTLEAVSEIHTAWTAMYNVAGTPLDACISCHNPHSMDVYNPYGRDIYNEILAGFDAYQALANVEPVDSDGDGFSNIAEINALTFPGDPNSFPASTITITAAEYSYVAAQLDVKATSDYGANAALEVAGFGPMAWVPNKSVWRLSVDNLAVPPASVTVCGVSEGCITVP